MSKERLRKLAQHLDKLPREDFDMTTFCGAACCIAGHVNKIAKLPGESLLLYEAADWLGLKYWANESGTESGPARLLFAPDYDDFYTATPKQAAKVIRHLIKTGKVEWERFVP